MKKKVVYLLKGMGIGGTELQSCRQLAAYDRSKYELFLVTLTPLKRAEDARHIPADVSFHTFDFAGVRSAGEWFKLARLFKKIRPDVVVSSVFDANTIAKLLSLFFGFAVLPREHSINVGKPRWQHLVDRLLSAIPLTHVTISHAIANHESRGSGIPQARYTVIHNGVNLDEIRRAEETADPAVLRRELGMPDDARAVICVARLKEQKNPRLALEAFAAFAGSHPRHVLVMVGDGGERPTLERRAEDLGLRERVFFAGSRPDALRFYALAEFSLLTSPLEGFPNVALESLAMGKPMVSTRSGGVEEILGEGVTGALAGHDAVSVAHAMSRVANMLKRERTAIEHRCRARAADFSMQKNTAAFETLFAEAAPIAPAGDARTHVVFALPGATMGGIERHLARQLRYFDKSKFRFSLILLFAQSGEQARAVFPNVPIQALGLSGILRPKSFFKTYAALKRLHPDIVVSSVYTTNTLIRPLKPLLRFRSIAREHNIFPEKPLRFRIADWLLAPLSDALVANSTDAGADMARNAWLPRDGVTVIQNGIDLDEMQEVGRAASAKALRRELGLMDERIILNVGRLRDQKRYPLMLEAYAEFRKRGGKHALVIIGDGPERTALESQAEKLGIRLHIVFGGRRDALPFYTIADIFLLTSEREGFPNVVLEALSFGVPVISTRVPGSTEVIKDGDNGFLVGNEPIAIAHALEALARANESERAAYATRCRASVVPYDMRENVRRYEELFARVMYGKKR